MNADEHRLNKTAKENLAIAVFVLLCGVICAKSVFAADDVKQEKPVARLTVNAGNVERVDTPVTVELPGGISGAEIRLVEIRDGNRVPVPSQSEKNEKGKSLSWILSGKTPPAVKRVYEIEKGKTAEGPGIDINDNDAALEVLCGGNPVLRYKYGVEPPPAGKAADYAKSGFIHPVWSPAGQVLTQIHPEDHIHHMGLWNAWTATEFEGRHVDFWNIRDKKGTVRFAKCLEKSKGPVFGGFKVLQEYVDLSAPGGARIALNDNLEVRVWNISGAGKGYWLFDWVSVQHCASSSPLHLLQYRYGGLGFRATTEWGINNSDYLTSEGKTRKDGHTTRARWCAMTGKTSKGEAGLLMMTHPRNHEYPEPIRIWSEKDNNEGKIFFNFCPIQKKDIVMEQGKDYEFRYRICAYDGTMTKESAERLSADFATPPDVKLEMLR